MEAITSRKSQKVPADRTIMFLQISLKALQMKWRKELILCFCWMNERMNKNLVFNITLWKVHVIDLLIFPVPISFSIENHLIHLLFWVQQIIMLSVEINDGFSESKKLCRTIQHTVLIFTFPPYEFKEFKSTRNL